MIDSTGLPDDSRQRLWKVIQACGYTEGNGVLAEMPTREMFKDAASAAKLETSLSMMHIEALLTSESERVIAERRVSWTAVLCMTQFPCRVSAGADLIAEAGKGVCLPLAPSVAFWRAAYFAGQQQPLLCNFRAAARILSCPQLSRPTTGAKQLARLPVACIP